MEHQKIENNDKDVRTSWFMQQHYSPEELQQLFEWENEGGRVCKVVELETGFNAFHVLDTENKIDLSFQKEREMLLRWVARMGYKTENGETFKGD